MCSRGNHLPADQPRTSTHQICRFGSPGAWPRGGRTAHPEIGLVGLRGYGFAGRIRQASAETSAAWSAAAIVALNGSMID